MKPTTPLKEIIRLLPLLTDCEVEDLLGALLQHLSEERTFQFSERNANLLRGLLD